ncbi:hypothetical protein NV379_05100 [Paenibacillus sp. N1-5-1-14]|uniref:hypothetical protein n=1 Tax=Paenibacillus radicibacter TaxID=2972488 RepID=UPI002158D81C|nr:hypothetical protein [Paenibacillus radicibacter]MCR8642028.1 hypothetical protein [Paenibacillus radicibacter]
MSDEYASLLLKCLFETLGPRGVRYSVFSMKISISHHLSIIAAVLNIGNKEGDCKVVHDFAISRHENMILSLKHAFPMIRKSGFFYF